MSISKINPTGLYDGAATGMSQATVDTELGLVFISGQVDWNMEHAVKHQDIASQTKSAIKNLVTVLEESHSSVENLLQLRVYVRGEVADHMDHIVPIITEQLGKSRPALTGVGVASLASPDILIEIEAIAKVARAI
ncbi:RidA family protein [Gynuella sp.]|uniref:RidA family protein n=1 Tax=Gynuella sp. TaxID=2969146 RepID=UPI003D129217